MTDNKEDISKDRQLANTPEVSIYQDGLGGAGIQITGQGGNNGNLYYVQIPFNKIEELFEKIKFYNV